MDMFFRNCVISVALTLVVATGASGPAAAHSLKDLETELYKREQYVEIVHRDLPPFTLRDANGRSVSLADFRGKVVVLYFIYASCPDVCPLQSEKIADIQRKINLTPMRDAVEFVAITTDPEHDTPDVLKAYGPAHGLDPANWVFLTSGAEHPTATRELAHQFGLEFTPSEDGTLMHGVVTHVIDREGRLRARFHGLKFDPTNLILEVNALVNDHDRHSLAEEPPARPTSPVASETLPYGLVLWMAIGLVLLAGGWLIGTIIFFRLRRR
jgi:protein SCO1/2